MIGPICPIYGFGASITWYIFRDMDIFSNELPGYSQPAWKIFAVCAVGSAILEYSISFLLERIFNAKWWDYSDTPLNINGRICLPATCGFGVAGVLIVKYFFPWLDRYDDVVLYHPLVNEVLALAFMLVIGMDIALTEASLTSLLEILDEAQEKFDERMEAGVASISQMPGAVKERAVAGVETITSAPARLKDMTAKVPRLSWRQRYHLHSIKTFVKPQHRKRARQLRDTADIIKRYTVGQIGKKD